MKFDQRGAIARAALRISERWSGLGMEEFLGGDVLLVPAPRSAPLSAPEALWPSRRICEELLAQRLGIGILPCLERIMAVPKAAFAKPGERTKALGHSETMRVSTTLLPLAHRMILVVDDIVTSGSMLLASTSLVADAFPGSTVLAFGLVRTIDSASELIDPCVGRISLDPVSGLTRRRP